MAVGWPPVGTGWRAGEHSARRIDRVHRDVVRRMVGHEGQFPGGVERDRFRQVPGGDRADRGKRPGHAVGAIHRDVVGGRVGDVHETVRRVHGDGCRLRTRGDRLADGRQRAAHRIGGEGGDAVRSQARHIHEPPGPIDRHGHRPEPGELRRVGIEVSHGAGVGVDCESPDGFRHGIGDVGELAAGRDGDGRRCGARERTGPRFREGPGRGIDGKREHQGCRRVVQEGGDIRKAAGRVDGDGNGIESLTRADALPDRGERSGNAVDGEGGQIGRKEIRHVQEAPRRVRGQRQGAGAGRRRGARAIQSAGFTAQRVDRNAAG